MELSFWEGLFVERLAAGRDVQLRERPVAEFAAQGFALVLEVGPVQPTVVGLQEPLSVPFQRLEPVVVPEPQPARAEEPLQVSLPKALSEEVPALLALILAEPLAFPQPPVPGEALKLHLEVLPVSQPLPRSLVLPEGLRHRARPPLLRLRPHRLPRGAQKLEGAIPEQVAEPNALSFERERSNGVVRNSQSQCSKSFGNSQL